MQGIVGPPSSERGQLPAWGASSSPALHVTPVALNVVRARPHQTEHRLSIARLLDVDGDGRVDCATYDGTWRYADGANCPDRRRSDAVPFTDADRLAADRLLAIEGEIRERWLEPLIRD